MLPLTVLGLVVGLLATVAGNEELAWWCWTVPAVARGRVARRSRSSATCSRAQAGVDVIAVLAIVGALLLGRVADRLRHRGHARDRRLAGALRRGPRPPRAVGARRRAPRASSTGTRTGPSRTGASRTSRSATACSSSPARSCRWTATSMGAAATLDESALTGEARLVTREAGDPVSSGTVNAGAPFDLLATATAEHSTYAGIVRLVEEAQSSQGALRAPGRPLRAPVRAPDARSSRARLGRPRATRCAPCRCSSWRRRVRCSSRRPIAIVAGISRSARRGIIVKGGGAARGHRPRPRPPVRQDRHADRRPAAPRRRRVGARPDARRRCCATRRSLEQVSPHVLASSIVSGARERGVALALPDDAEEIPAPGSRDAWTAGVVHVGTADFATDGGRRCRPGRATSAAG